MMNIKIMYIKKISIRSPVFHSNNKINIQYTDPITLTVNIL